MRHRILLAVVPEIAARLRECLGSGYEYCLAPTEEAAEAALSVQKLNLAIVSYHFDSLHPYRLIQRIRELPSTAHMPILLVRGLQLFYQNHASPEQIGESYLLLGATAFFSLYEEEQRVGMEKAAEEFRDLVSLLLSAGIGGCTPRMETAKMALPRR